MTMREMPGREEARREGRGTRGSSRGGREEGRGIRAVAGEGAGRFCTGRGAEIVSLASNRAPLRIPRLILWPGSAGSVLISFFLPLPPHRRLPLLGSCLLSSCSAASASSLASPSSPNSAYPPLTLLAVLHCPAAALMPQQVEEVELKGSARRLWGPTAQEATSADHRADTPGAGAALLSLPPSPPSCLPFPPQRCC